MHRDTGTDFAGYPIIRLLPTTLIPVPNCSNCDLNFEVLNFRYVLFRFVYKNIPGNLSFVLVTANYQPFYKLFKKSRKQSYLWGDLSRGDLLSGDRRPAGDRRCLKGDRLGGGDQRPVGSGDRPLKGGDLDQRRGVGDHRRGDRGDRARSKDRDRDRER